MTNYTVYSASGNPTALVWALSQSQEARKEMNNEIMAHNPLVEQVGFLLPNNCGITYPGIGGTTASGNFSLKMAGGEFCGNAARCAIYAYLKGEEGTINLSVSGAEHPIRGGLRILKDDTREVWCEMPVLSGVAESIFKTEEGTIVKLQGISHLVIDTDQSKKYIEGKGLLEMKASALELLKKHKLISQPACGVIFITAKPKETLGQAEISILPVVYVREVDTLFLETACGTGTTAVALSYSAKQERDFILSAMQPYGESLTVRVEYKEGEFGKVLLEGPIKELGKST